MDHSLLATAKRENKLYVFFNRNVVFHIILEHRTAQIWAQYLSYAPSNETEQNFVLDRGLLPLQIMMLLIRALLTNCCSNGLIASCCNDCCCGRCENENWLLPRAIGGRANWNPWLPFGWMVNGLGDIWKKSCWREAGVCDCCFRRRKKNRIYVQKNSITHFVAVRLDDQQMISIMVVIYFVSWIKLSQVQSDDMKSF